MYTQAFTELFGYETPNFEQFIDLVFEKNKVSLRCYIKQSKIPIEITKEFISLLVINYGFIMDKQNYQKMELIDSKTGKSRFYIWNDGTIEYHSIF
jgi:hypothetical protein